MEQQILANEVRAELVPIIQEAASFTIATVDEYNEGGKILVALAGRKKLAKSKLEPIRIATYDAYQKALDLIKEVIKPIEDVEGIVKKRMTTFKIAYDHQKEAEERAAREAARKELEERRLAEALELEKEGKTEQAEALLEAPAPTVQIVKAEDPPEAKPEGISYREKYSFEVVDPALIPRDYMVPDLVKIGGVVRGSKGTIDIPGVRVIVEKIAVVKS